MLTPYAPTVVEADALHEEPARMAYAEPTIFASTIEEPRRSSGLGIWLAAAASLVLGIVIGFASGYRAGQGSSEAAATVENPAPTSGSASPGQPFSESSVAEPVRVEPEEIVPAPPGAPAPRVPPAPAPPVGRTLSGPPAAPDRGAPVAPAPRGGVARPTVTPPPVVEEKPPLTGPASLQVVSRPAGAEVIVDGKSVGRTPLSMEMTPGSHDVRLSLPGFKGWATTVDVKTGVTTRVSGSLEQ